MITLRSISNEWRQVIFRRRFCNTDFCKRRSKSAAGGVTNVNIVSLFRPGDLSKIDLIARWEATSQSYQIYDPKRPEALAFQFLNPNLGHWVKATASLTIQPDMVLEAEGDVDCLL